MEKADKVFYYSNNPVIDQSPSFLMATSSKSEQEHLEKDRTIALLRSQLTKESKKLRMAQNKLECIQSLVDSNENASIKVDLLRSIIRSCVYEKVIAGELSNEKDQEFMSRLKKDFPTLSPNDLRICTLLKHNLSTKEVAQRLAIGPASANKARYRIRKKLNLSKGDELIQFILGY